MTLSKNFQKTCNNERSTRNSNFRNDVSAINRGGGGRAAWRIGIVITAVRAHKGRPACDLGDSLVLLGCPGRRGLSPAPPEAPRKDRQDYVEDSGSGHGTV